MMPILFLPGAGGSASFWRPVAERLADLGPTHVLGYPGFDGAPREPALRSTADLHRWIVARLPNGRSHVVAQSMGGIFAVRLAAELPERVACLVLVATTGGVDARSQGAEDWRPEYEASLPGAPRWFVDDRTDLTGALPSIRAPTLLVWSDADPTSPLAVAELLGARIPAARLAVVRGGAHAFAHERPEEVAAIVRAHLLAHGGGAGGRVAGAGERLTGDR